MDKKSQHYTAPDNYSDLGQMRTFTHIDHDIKPKISLAFTPVKEEPRKAIVLTKEDILCKGIFDSGIAETHEFIEDYDNLMQRFGQERLRKGSYIENLHHGYGGKPWYKALHKLFTEHLTRRKEELENYLNKEYGY